MKFALFALLVSATFSLHADEPSDAINVTPISILGSASGRHATELIDFLKSVHVQPYLSNGNPTYNLEHGQVITTNGAACDNGQSTYAATLQVVDDKHHKVQTLKIGDANDCHADSTGEKFITLLNAYGADKLDEDCGMGHCWLSVKSIKCVHFADASLGDVCHVVTTIDDQN